MVDKIIKNFNTDLCFKDVAEKYLDPVKKSRKLRKNNLGEFADPRFAILRYFASEAYFLTANAEIGTGGERIIESFNSHEYIENLILGTVELIDSIKANKEKYPYLLNYSDFSNIKKGKPYVDESILLIADWRDNPAADPESAAKFFKGYKRMPRCAPFGVMALGFFDAAIDCAKAGNLEGLFQMMHRAKKFVDAGHYVWDQTAMSKQYRSRASSIAAAGGTAKGNKFKVLKNETLRLYLAGNWKSVPIAAQEITPKIVAMSKGGNGNLLPSTTKPLEWIRAFTRSQKVTSTKHEPHCT